MDASRRSATHERMVHRQADQHYLIETQAFASRQEYVLHLMHSFAYSAAARLAVHKDVLDVGCNVGYGTAMLGTVARHVTGVDVAARAVESARRNYSCQGVEYRLVDGFGLPFRDRSFDLVVSLQVLEHVVDHDLFLSEIHRVLKRNGVAVLSTPNACLRLDPGMRPWNELHVREWDCLSLSTLLRSHFPRVEVLGLFAVPATYSIEFERVQSALVRHRRELRGGRFGGAVKRLTRLVVPSFLRLQIQRRRGASPFVAKWMKEHTLADFWYQGDGIDDALDQLAVCGHADLSVATSVSAVMSARRQELFG